MSADETLAALERLAKLKADGIITEAEFAAEKAAVLAGRDPSATEAVAAYASRPATPLAALPTVIYAQPSPAPRSPRRFGRYALIGLVVGLVLEVPRYLHSNAAGALPTCDSAAARNGLNDMVEHGATEKVTSLQLLDLSNIVERSYDATKPERVCAADFTLNTGSEHRGYRFYKTSNGQGTLIEIMDDPGPSAASPSTGTVAEPADAPKSVRQSLIDKANDPSTDTAQRELIEGALIADTFQRNFPDTRPTCTRNVGVEAGQRDALSCVNGQGLRYNQTGRDRGLGTSATNELAKQRPQRIGPRPQYRRRDHEGDDRLIDDVRAQTDWSSTRNRARLTEAGLY